MNGSARTCSLRGFQILIGSVDLDALKIPARKAEFSLTENALSPFQAEPTQIVVVPCSSQLGGTANDSFTEFFALAPRPAAKGGKEPPASTPGGRFACTP